MGGKITTFEEARSVLRELWKPWPGEMWGFTAAEWRRIGKEADRMGKIRGRKPAFTTVKTGQGMVSVSQATVHITLSDKAWRVISRDNWPPEAFGRRK